MFLHSALFYYRSFCPASFQEHLTKEILQERLNELDKNLTSSFNQKLDTITKKIENKLYQSDSIPLAFKWSNIAVSFLAGILTMIILSGIVWYQWIRPYQVSKEMTKEATDGTIYIDTSKAQILKQDDKIYIQIQ